MTTVIHHRDRGSIPSDEYVYIGRPSIWGNPFSHRHDSIATTIVSSRDEAIDRYRTWIQTQPFLLRQLPTLKGKTLGCWCKPRSCHGDILAELADAVPDASSSST